MCDKVETAEDDREQENRENNVFVTNGKVKRFIAGEKE